MCLTNPKNLQGPILILWTNTNDPTFKFGYHQLNPMGFFHLEGTQQKNCWRNKLILAHHTISTCDCIWCLGVDGSLFLCFFFWFLVRADSLGFIFQFPQLIVIEENKWNMKQFDMWQKSPVPSKNRNTKKWENSIYGNWTDLVVLGIEEGQNVMT